MRKSQPGAKRKSKAEFLKGKKTMLVFLAWSELDYQFVVHCSLWKVKHRICVTTVKKIRRCTSKLENEIFKFSISDFTLFKKTWNFEVLCFDVWISFWNLNNVQRFSVLNTRFDSAVAYVVVGYNWSEFEHTSYYTSFVT